MEKQNYYDILEISRNASQLEISNAFREMAKKYHPDKHNGNPLSDLALREFQKIQEAYATLSDASKRSIYDFNSQENTDTYSNTQNKFEIKLNEAIVMINKRLFDRALQIISELIIENPAFGLLYAMKGEIFYLKENFPISADLYLQAEAKATTNDEWLNSDFYLKMASALESVKKYDLAIEKYNRAAALEGVRTPEIVVGLMFCYSESGNDLKAHELLTELKSIDPTNPVLKEIENSINTNNHTNNDGEYERAGTACAICAILECIFDIC
jgi:curved DNA-binding protein CbpA